MSLSSCLSGALPATANMAVDVRSHGAPSTVIAPTVATEEPPAIAVSSHQLGLGCCEMGCK